MKNLIFFFLTFSFTSKAQTINVLTSGKNTSLRGLGVVTEKIIWASGTHGTVARSVNGGKSWKWMTVEGFEKADFRDIEAFDSLTAIIMAVAEPAYILKTINGGTSWNIVYVNKIKGMFLDAMDFSDNRHGVVIGDPVSNNFFIAQTVDGGNTWLQVSKNYAEADSGEACFASSGTNIKSLKHKYYFVSGGVHSKLFNKSRSFQVPILQGKETTGANSLAIKNKRTIIIVGGDFKTPDSILKGCVISLNSGSTWTQPAIAPHGYRSCVEYINKNNWITCGLNGVDCSGDNGKTWQWVSKESFHVCRKSKNGNAVFLAGENGKIGKMKPL